MANRIAREKRTTCVANLCFSIPLKFSISMNPKEWEEYKKDCEYLGMTSPLVRLKHNFFKVFNVNSAQDTIYADDDVNEKYRGLLDAYVKCLGTDQNKFINWVMSDKEKLHRLAEEERKNEK